MEFLRKKLPPVIPDKNLVLREPGLVEQKTKKPWQQRHLVTLRPFESKIQTLIRPESHQWKATALFTALSKPSTKDKSINH